VVGPTVGSLPRLQHGLDSVLKQRGPQILQDPVTKQYHFDPYLHHIPPVDTFPLSSLPPFQRVSQDKVPWIH
jgi:hypothetical protein